MPLTPLERGGCIHVPIVAGINSSLKIGALVCQMLYPPLEHAD